MLYTPFRVQVITLSVLPLSVEEKELNLLCPARALRIYIKCSTAFKQSEQFFVCFGGRTKRASGHEAVGLVDAIALTYASLGLYCSREQKHNPQEV